MVKHNKLKNSGLLFELLVRQITTDTLNNKDSEAINILKKYFYNTDLLKEYRIYSTIASTKNQSEVKANILIEACVSSYNKLNKASIGKQKYDLIAEVKKHYNIDEFFKAKVDNYKVLASVYQLLEMTDAKSFDAKVYAECKGTLLEHVSSKKADSRDEALEEFASLDSGTRSMVVRMASKKFNDKYSETLNEDQKGLLNAYITNISTSDNLRQYCNKQIIYIKEQVDAMITDIPDEVRKVKLTEVVKSLQEIPSTKHVSDMDVSNIMYYFELIKEYKDVNAQ